MDALALQANWLCLSAISCSEAPTKWPLGACQATLSITEEPLTHLLAAFLGAEPLLLLRTEAFGSGWRLCQCQLQVQATQHCLQAIAGLRRVRQACWSPQSPLTQAHAFARGRQAGWPSWLVPAQIGKLMEAGELMEAGAWWPSESAPAVAPTGRPSAKNKICQPLSPKRPSIHSSSAAMGLPSTCTPGSWLPLEMLSPCRRMSCGSLV